MGGHGWKPSLPPTYSIAQWGNSLLGTASLLGQFRRLRPRVACDPCVTCGPRRGSSPRTRLLQTKGPMPRTVVTCHHLSISAEEYFLIRDNPAYEACTSDLVNQNLHITKLRSGADEGANPTRWRSVEIHFKENPVPPFLRSLVNALIGKELRLSLDEHAFATCSAFDQPAQFNQHALKAIEEILSVESLEWVERVSPTRCATATAQCTRQHTQHTPHNCRLTPHPWASVTLVGICTIRSRACRTADASFICSTRSAAGSSAWVAPLSMPSRLASTTGAGVPPTSGASPHLNLPRPGSLSNGSLAIGSNISSLFLQPGTAGPPSYSAPTCATVEAEAVAEAMGLTPPRLMQLAPC